MDSIPASALAAVICTLLTQRLSTRQAELCSETVCWMILPILFKIANRSDIRISTASFQSKPGSQYASSRSLWIVAVGIATACSYKAEIGKIALIPALTPLLLIVEGHLQSELQASKLFDSWFFSPLVNTVWGTTLAALFATLTLSDWNLRASALSVVPVTALLIVYVALIPRVIKGSRFLPHINVEEAIVPLSLRVVAILVVAMSMQTVAFGFPTNIIIHIGLLGLAKALSWYYICRLTRYTSWVIATAITTFSMISICDPFMQSSDFQAFSNVTASVLTLTQIIHMFPKQTKGRSAMWILALVSLIPYLANIVAIRTAQSSVPPSFGHAHNHPVEALTHNAKVELRDLLQRQSKNYTAAYNEYRHRYRIEPPPGFEDWYEFAAAHQSPIIDEFDTIFDLISPFWSLSGKEVIEATSYVQDAPNNDLWHCTFSSDDSKTHCTHPHRTYDRHIESLFNKLLGDLHGTLPDVDFLVNHLDEPRVLIPPRSLQGEESNGKGQFNVTNMSRRPSWDAISKFCASQQSHKSTSLKQSVETFGLPFVTDIFSATDLCRHPEYSAMHGLVMSPTSFYPIEGLVPILSTGAPSTMGDILYPSPAYIESEFLYDESHDTDWDRKHNNVYWAGSTTGGFVSDGLWPYYQRQRFVKLAQNLERKDHYYLRERNGVVSRMKSSFLNSRLFDVTFTRIFQCERKYCRDQRAYFNVRSWADKDQALRSRLVFDIDGNGISGRYYKLLASKSAPLKQTLLREWHDERLMPWIHYIPVSQGMEEVPELVFYLISTEAGQQRAKEIAEQGREWFAKAFRDIDLSIYTYRLMLELARLQDPAREAI